MADLPSDRWLIHKAGRGWYRPQAQGYTSDTDQAGRFGYADAVRHSYPNGPSGPRDGITIKHEDELTGYKFPKPTTSTEVLALVGALQGAVEAWDTHNKSGDMMQGWWVSDARAALAAWEAKHG